MDKIARSEKAIVNVDREALRQYKANKSRLASMQDLKKRVDDIDTRISKIEKTLEKILTIISN